LEEGHFCIGANQKGYFKNMAKKYEAATANPILESNLLNH